MLSETLNPYDGFKSFQVDNICILANEFYPEDFVGDELEELRRKLEHFKFDVVQEPKFS